MVLLRSVVWHMAAVSLSAVFATESRAQTVQDFIKSTEGRWERSTAALREIAAKGEGTIGIWFDNQGRANIRFQGREAGVLTGPAQKVGERAIMTAIVPGQNNMNFTNILDCPINVPTTPPMECFHTVKDSTGRVVSNNGQPWRLTFWKRS
jgi:hypothetical protein